MATKEILLTKGKATLVDEEDYEWLNQFSWCASDSGNGIFYAHRKEAGKTILMHRFIMGTTDRKIHVDHKDNDSLNNTRNNLRECSQTNNNRNKSSHANSTSRYVGVCWDKNRNKWKADIYVNKKLLYLGRFLNEEDAAMAYDIVAKKEFGEFANLNFNK